MIHPLKHQSRLEISESIKASVYQLMLMSHTSVFINDSKLAAKVIQEVETKGKAYESFRYEASCPDLFTADGQPYHTRYQTLHHALQGSTEGGDGNNGGLKLPGLYTAFLKDLFDLFDEYAKKKAFLDMKRVYTLFAFDIICKAAFNFEVNAVSGSQLGKTLYQAITVIHESQASSGLYPVDAKQGEEEQRNEKGARGKQGKEREGNNSNKYSQEDITNATKQWQIFLETISEHIRYQAKKYQESYGELDHKNNLSHALVLLTTLPKEAQSIPELQKKSNQALIGEIHQIVKHGHETLAALFMWITVCLFQNKKVSISLCLSLSPPLATLLDF